MSKRGQIDFMAQAGPQREDQTPPPGRIACYTMPARANAIPQQRSGVVSYQDHRSMDINVCLCHHVKHLEAGASPQTQRQQADVHVSIGRARLGFIAKGAEQRDVIVKIGMRSWQGGGTLEHMGPDCQWIASRTSDVHEDPMKEAGGIGPELSRQLF